MRLALAEALLLCLGAVLALELALTHGGQQVPEACVVTVELHAPRVEHHAQRVGNRADTWLLIAQRAVDVFRAHHQVADASARGRGQGDAIGGLGAAGVFDVAQHAVQLLADLHVGARPDWHSMDGWWGLRDLAGHVRHVLADVIHHQAGPGATRILFTLSLDGFVPLLRVRRIGKAQVFLDLQSLLTSRIERVLVQIARFLEFIH